jgi:hypothetical protein
MEISSSSAHSSDYSGDEDWDTVDRQAGARGTHFKPMSMQHDHEKRRVTFSVFQDFDLVKHAVGSHAGSGTPARGPDATPHTKLMAAETLIFTRFQPRYTADHSPRWASRGLRARPKPTVNLACALCLPSPAATLQVASWTPLR